MHRIGADDMARVLRRWRFLCLLISGSRAPRVVVNLLQLGDTLLVGTRVLCRIEMLLRGAGIGTGPQPVDKALCMGNLRALKAIRRPSRRGECEQGKNDRQRAHQPSPSS